MAYIEKSELKSLYTESTQEAKIWREDYPSYERLADNGLIDNLDSNQPEVNDGSLAASLFKLPKRIVSSKLSGTVKAMNRDEAYIAELANMVWNKEIIPNANTQAPFTRKWKDAVRKAAIYGSVPLITIFVEKNGKRHSDFIVAQPQDVTLEPGKVSDYDSDVIFWDVYYSKLQLKNIIEEAKAEGTNKKDTDQDSTNKWNIPALEEILASDDQEERESQNTPRQIQTKNVKPKGFKFCIGVQRGVDAPYYMYHKATNETVREWSNPDPTGDVNIHFLYCYQDFINPYGIGIVKLAGGTQNVLDYMRRADVLATQLGLEPPLDINGDADSVDLDSLVYANRALWFSGNATITPVPINNATYQGLPERMSMYKSSLNQLMPMGDTTVSATAGDPLQSKTPAGVKQAEASLSIDDDDFKDNLYITYAAVAKSMINTHFANMEGTDLMKLTDEERDILVKAGLEFPEGPDGEVSNQVELVWDTIRAEFDFEVDPENDKAKDDATKLEGLTRVAELSASDPTFAQDLMAVNKKFNKGELYAEMIALTTDNDKIVTDIGPEEQTGEMDPTTGQPMPQQPVDPAAQGAQLQQAQGEQAMQQSDQQHQMKMQQSNELHQAKLQKMSTPSPSPQNTQQGQPQVSEDEMKANVEAIMQEYGVDENTALAALAAEHQGFPKQDVINHLKSGAKL